MAGAECLCGVWWHAGPQPTRSLDAPIGLGSAESDVSESRHAAGMTRYPTLGTAWASGLVAPTEATMGPARVHDASCTDTLVMTVKNEAHLVRQSSQLGRWESCVVYVKARRVSRGLPRAPCGAR